METLREAFEAIKGYCGKHEKCGRGCVFCDDDGLCILMNGEVPADWELPENGEVDGE